MSNKVLIFAGTQEGRLIAEHFNDFMSDEEKSNLYFSVATEYGAEILSEMSGFNIMQGRLQKDEIENFIFKNNIAAVVDSTHPYADKASDNIRDACNMAKIEYLRLYREEEELNVDNIITVGSPDEAADEMNATEGRILLTTGSKDLPFYSKRVKNFEEKLICRVLPSVESINIALDSGYPSKNIIGMQGPFTGEMNIATLRQYGCNTLLTKSTGKAGGFKDKILCAEEGYKIIVIKRPTSETGYDLDSIIKKIEAILGVSKK